MVIIIKIIISEVSLTKDGQQQQQAKAVVNCSLVNVPAYRLASNTIRVPGMERTNLPHIIIPSLQNSKGIVMVAHTENAFVLRTLPIL
jgi:hypothetical protein